MSLLNQVLQELDARGANDAVVSAQTAHIKLAPARARWWAQPWLILVLLVIVVAVTLWLMKAWPPAKPELPATVNSAAPAAASASKQASVAAIHEPAQPSVAPISPAVPSQEETPNNSFLLQGLKMAESLDRLPKELAPVSASSTANSAPTPAAALSAKMQASPPEEAKSSSKLAVATKLEIQPQNSNPQQRAENEYRRANQFMQQAKTQDALQALEQALLHDKHHLAARQALVNLLLSSNRSDEALRQLQLGLQLDPGHTTFAMMLARLQAERNDLATAIETMYGHLPIAVNNAEFLAALAAMLQRDKRHRAAIEHFLQALQLHPENGVWWMGLGISLQAENRFAQAKDAFVRAKQSRSLNPQLSAFVEQKLTQIEAKLQHLAQDVQ